jgi:hypothetical protein
MMYLFYSRWGFVIHGGIDGYSRLMVFLSVACNNRAATVFNSFIVATSSYGIPSRIRADHGTENNEVETFINVMRGLNRGSMIRGRSVHNQRIERFWRDLYHGCTNVYYDLFHFMEDSGILDVNNNVHRWALQYVFTPRIQRRITYYQNQWNNHRISTMHGQTPRQLYVEGALRLLGSRHDHINEIFCFDPNDGEELVVNDIPDYGIDWEGPIPEEDNNTVIVVDPACPISTELLEELKESILPLGPSVDRYGINIYLSVLHFITSD